MNVSKIATIIGTSVTSTNITSALPTITQTTSVMLSTQDIISTGSSESTVVVSTNVIDSLTTIISMSLPNCTDQCSLPAQCNLTNGLCQCPISLMNLVNISNSTPEICQCPGYPLANYTNDQCISPSININHSNRYLISMSLTLVGPTWFLLNFNLISASRIINVNLPLSLHLEHQV